MFDMPPFRMTETELDLPSAVLCDDGHDVDFTYSDVENIDYRKPTNEFDLAFEGLKVAAQELADHKVGSPYTEKAEEYLRAALPLVRLVRSKDSARNRLDALMKLEKVEVRSNASHPDVIMLFKLAQKRVGRATTAAERNKWASILVRALNEGWDADTMITKVKAVGGINKAAAAFQPKLRKPDAPKEQERHHVEVKLCVVGLGDAIEVVGMIPASVAQSIAKKLRSSLSVGGVQ